MVTAFGIMLPTLARAAPHAGRSNGMLRGLAMARRRTSQIPLKSVPSTTGKLRIPREICPN
jgi:hypothetical protein